MKIRLSMLPKVASKRPEFDIYAGMYLDSSCKMKIAIAGLEAMKPVAIKRISSAQASKVKMSYLLCFIIFFSDFFHFFLRESRAI